MTSQEITALAQESGGLTLDYFGNPIEYDYGYQIGINTENVIIKPTLEPEDIERAVSQNYSYTGLWYDGTNWYIEPSLRALSASAAHKLGRIHNQKEIYDWAKRQSIPVEKEST